MNHKENASFSSRSQDQAKIDNRLSEGPAISLRLFAIMAFVVLIISGCGLQPTEPAPFTDQIIVRAWEEAPRNDPAACRVGYDLVYPADLEPRDFDLFVALGREIAPGNPEGALRENGGTLMIPRPEHDHRVDRADPTANVFRVRLMTFSPCVQQQFGERFLPTLAFRADKCSQQHCSALKFETPPGGTTARFRIVTKQP